MVQKVHCKILDQLIILGVWLLIKHYKAIVNTNQKQKNIAYYHLIRIYDAIELVYKRKRKNKRIIYNM